MKRSHVSASPSLAKNIDYHLDKLANYYKKSQGGLMEMLVKQNPSNKKFETKSKSTTPGKSKFSANKSSIGKRTLQPNVKM